MPERRDRNAFKDADPRSINMENAGERAYWCKSLMASESELTEAVNAVGESAEQVKRWLVAKALDE